MYILETHKKNDKLSCMQSGFNKLRILTCQKSSEWCISKLNIFSKLGKWRCCHLENNCIHPMKPQSRYPAAITIHSQQGPSKAWWIWWPTFGLMKKSKKLVWLAQYQNMRGSCRPWKSILIRTKISWKSNKILQAAIPNGDQHWRQWQTLSIDHEATSPFPGSQFCCTCLYVMVQILSIIDYPCLPLVGNLSMRLGRQEQYG